MKTTIKKRVYHALLCLIAVLALLLPFGLNFTNGGGRYAITASADDDPVIAVHKYDVHMTVRGDRKIDVRENITVEFLDYGLSMFYRSLPTDGARYENIEAKCAGNSDFYYYVADNEEMASGDFIDVNCVGNAAFGQIWTYEITYVMEQATNEIENGMIIDVVGFGWQVPLHNVTVQMVFPEKPISTKVYTDVFGVASGNEVKEAWLNETTFLLTADVLDIVYSERYDEKVAGGITLEFSLPEGVLLGYTKTRLFTHDMWKILLGGVGILFAVLAVVFLSKKQEMVTVVNLTPPDGMDPMKMGKWIDGAVNNEDITSMVYYFANKGYLKIDFSDEDDPELITDLDCLPEEAPAYEKTLFNGLFDGASAWHGEEVFAEAEPKLMRAVKVSELEGKFFEASQTATKQIPDAPPMYEAKSVFAYLSGPIIGLILGFLLPFLISARIGGGYRYMLGVVLFVPLAANALLGYVIENHRYKWKEGKRVALFLVELLIAVIFTLIFVFAMAEHVMTEYEKWVLCIGVFAASFITSGALARSDEYLKVLENILGFKEFIVVTEEDKIKVMLEENPELYYDVLPYAQVLGVTNEWEGKFKALLIEPPNWYVSGGNLTYFDCYILHRCLNRSMMASMARAAAAAASNGAGRYIGRSGGGGSFGGFGGGGFGGGGGGAR